MSWWTCLKGALAYATGTPRSTGSACYAAGECAACEHMQVWDIDDVPEPCGSGAKILFGDRRPLTGWCGQPGETGHVTCGCLVLAENSGDELPRIPITIRGEPVLFNPAGKTTREEQKCPAGRW